MSDQIDETRTEAPQDAAPATTATDEPTSAPTDEPTSEATDEATSEPKAPLSKRLEEEGEVAADYLEELLDIADLDGDIDIDVENGRASVSVVGDEASTVSLRRLAGRDGAVLESLQELTRLAVQTRTGERTRLMLDVAGFRAARKAELQKVAEKAVDAVKRDGQAVRLDPMTPFERKVVHDVIAAAGLSSESEGVEPSRRVVVQPAS